MQDPAQPCGSAAVAVAAVEVVAPAVSANVPVLSLSVGRHAVSGPAFAPGDHVLAPPLVLRI